MTSILAILFKAPEQINPAVVMHDRLARIEREKGLTHLDMLALAPEVQKAVALGQQEVELVQQALATIKDAPAIAQRRVPRGF